jgi:hypothetical protein
VVAKVKESLAARKQAAQNFYVGIFDFRRVYELEIWKKYHNEVTNRFAGFQNLSDSEDKDRVSENNKENI